MKKILYRLYWIYWRFTGYEELSLLIRSHVGNYNALTPVGLKRMKELGEKEGDIYRGMMGIKK